MTKVAKTVKVSHCDFCGQIGANTSLSKLIEGPGCSLNRPSPTPVYICCDCVKKCNELVTDTFSPDSKPIKITVTGSRIANSLQKQAASLIESAFQAGYQKGLEAIDG